MIGAWQAPAVRAEAEGTDVLLRRDGALGRLTLNRPKAINALTLEMVRQLHAALDELADDPAVRVVLIDGAGERGLCAGGDIVALQRSAIEGTDEARTFWAEEYALNARIARYPKPVVAIMDGIVMGGGIGLAGHAQHRLATERLMAAMPEVGIGFAPDVGGTWLLAHAPGELGTHLALTAGRAGAADAVLLGLADRVIAHEVAGDLIAALAGGGAVDAAIDAVASAHPQEVPPGDLGADRAWIDACYTHAEAEVIVAALDARPEERAHAAAAAIRRASPTSVKVTLAALRRARALPSLEAALEQELTVSTGFLRCADFVEGIRAQVVEKDRNPRWAPSRLEEVHPDLVDAFFHDVPAATILSADHSQPGSTT